LKKNRAEQIEAGRKEKNGGGKKPCSFLLFFLIRYSLFLNSPCYETTKNAIKNRTKTQGRGKKPEEKGHRHATTLATLATLAALATSATPVDHFK
jgi:hypothetical protein